MMIATRRKSVKDDMILVITHNIVNSIVPGCFIFAFYNSHTNALITFLLFFLTRIIRIRDAFSLQSIMDGSCYISQTW